MLGDVYFYCRTGREMGDGDMEDSQTHRVCVCVDKNRCEIIRVFAGGRERKPQNRKREREEKRV